MFIPYSQPLDLPSTLESGQAFRWRREDPSLSSPNQWYYGVVFANAVKLRRSAAGIDFLCAPDEETALEPLIRSYLRLEDDLEAVYRSIERDERIGAAIGRYRGMRIMRQEPWECLVSFVCSSNSNIRRISANMEDLANAFGWPIRLGDRVTSTFPSPERLAEAREQRLRQLGLGFHAKYVAAVSRIVTEGGLDLMALREAPYDEALAALTALPGVGDKVANCVLLFSLDKLDAFPVDVWIERALREWYLDGREAEGKGKLSRRAMRPWAQEYFGPYAGYANQYLFHNRRLQGRSSS